MFRTWWCTCVCGCSHKSDSLRRLMTDLGSISFSGLFGGVFLFSRKKVMVVTVASVVVTVVVRQRIV